MSCKTTAFLLTSLMVVTRPLAAETPLRFEKTETIAPSLSLSVTVVPTGKEKFPPAGMLRRAFREIRQIYAGLNSTKGEIAQINRSSGGKISPPLLKLFRTCQQIYDWTGGLFDVVKGPPDVIPTMEVDFEAGTASFPEKGTSLDLSGVMRGYLTDRMIGLLKEEGYRHARVVSAEDTRTIGRDADGYWKVSIPDSQRRGALCRVSVESTGIATAGRDDLEEVIARVGRRFKQPTDLESVTVLAVNATTADALASTALLVGKERALRMLSTLRGVAALVQDEQGKVTPIGNVTAACLEE